jgi:hypothetical protein
VTVMVNQTPDNGRCRVAQTSICFPGLPCLLTPVDERRQPKPAKPLSIIDDPPFVPHYSLFTHHPER